MAADVEDEEEGDDEGWRDAAVGGAAAAKKREKAAACLDVDGCGCTPDDDVFSFLGAIFARQRATVDRKNRAGALVARYSEAQALQISTDTTAPLALAASDASGFDAATPALGWRAFNGPPEAFPTPRRMWCFLLSVRSKKTNAGLGAGPPVALRRNLPQNISLIP